MERIDDCVYYYVVGNIYVEASNCSFKVSNTFFVDIPKEYYDYLNFFEGMITEFKDGLVQIFKERHREYEVKNCVLLSVNRLN